MLDIVTSRPHSVYELIATIAIIVTRRLPSCVVSQQEASIQFIMAACIFCKIIAGIYTISSPGPLRCTSDEAIHNDSMEGYMLRCSL